MAILTGISRSRSIRKGDVVIAALASLFITAGMAEFDIQIYGTYVFPIFGCTATSTSQYCQSINATTSYTISGLGTISISGFQTYWIFFVGLDFFFAFTIAMAFALVARSAKVFVLYLMTIAGPFFFGLEDLMFYWFQSKPLPDSWPWLDQMGLGWNLFLSELLTPGVTHVTTIGIYASLLTVVGGLYFFWKVLGFKKK